MNGGFRDNRQHKLEVLVVLAGGSYGNDWSVVEMRERWRHKWRENDTRARDS